MHSRRKPFGQRSPSPLGACPRPRPKQIRDPPKIEAPPGALWGSRLSSVHRRAGVVPMPGAPSIGGARVRRGGSLGACPRSPKMSESGTGVPMAASSVAPARTPPTSVRS
ncbi:unnamed protein product [Ixodes persulcatus]